MRKRKTTWIQKLGLSWNKLIHGKPALCSKHSLNSPARFGTLDSFNCVKCTPEEIEKSKMQQEWFNLLNPEQISLAESDWNQLIAELENPKEPNPALIQAFKRYKEKYGTEDLLESI